MAETSFKITVNVEPDAPGPREAPMVGTVLKADDEKRFLLTVAYAANRIDPYVGMDRCKDFATDPVVERAAWTFMRKGAGTGMWHRPGGEGAAEVVENYIYRCDEPWIIKAADGTEQRIEKGDWLVGMVLSEDTWSMYKAGKIGGVSIQGTAKRRKPDAETLAQVRSRAVA